MYSTKFISPLELELDQSNPRFRIKGNPTQAEIRNYMILNEDLVKFAKKIAEMNVLLPGERIIIIEDEGRNIVLEGNRRTSVYQMLLDRSLIPDRLNSNFPIAKDGLISEIQVIPVDIVPTREIAMSYLAARHIEGVKEWSSISKWRISHEYYQSGITIQKISETLMLSVAKIKGFIANYKTLLRGINGAEWNKEEITKLDLLNIKPDRLIRFLRSKETVVRLELNYSDDFKLQSRLLSKEKLDAIIVMLTRKAFIEESLNTRSFYDDMKNFIEEICPELKRDPPVGDNTEDSEISEENLPSDSEENQVISPTTESDINPLEPFHPITTYPFRKSDSPYFFEGLDHTHLDATNQLTHGVLKLCKELNGFSKYQMVARYPVVAAYLTRGIIEQALVYYSKRNTKQASQKSIWEEINTSKSDPQLSFIFDKYNLSLSNYIEDKNIRSYFSKLFGSYNDTVNPLNWVVHRPCEYSISPKFLVELPSFGLLTVINYLISR